VHKASQQPGVLDPASLLLYSSDCREAVFLRNWKAAVL
jgi:hypothetical protein